MSNRKEVEAVRAKLVRFKLRRVLIYSYLFVVYFIDCKN